jgi:predicted AAA+ superfamily ATPase
MKRFLLLTILTLTVCFNSCQYDYIYPEIHVYKYWLDFRCNAIAKCTELGYEIAGTEFYMIERDKENNDLRKLTKPKDDKDKWIVCEYDAHTVQAYIAALMESYFFYDIKRFDIKGKEVLRTMGKFYIVDIGLRNYLLGFRDRDRGHIIENIVYFELLRRGYDVAIGKIGNTEIDFIATKTDDKIYIQVTESMDNESVRERELTPLTKINDNYEKIVLSLNPGLDNSYDGIKSINLINWLLDI